jgi:hypothetical protein
MVKNYAFEFTNILLLYLPFPHVWAIGWRKGSFCGVHQKGSSNSLVAWDTIYSSCERWIGVKEDSKL